MLTKREAVRAGRDHGINTATIVGLDIKSREGARNITDSIENGSIFVPSWLSGEWSGESMNEILGEPVNDRDLERMDDVANAYCEAADRGYLQTLRRMARDFR